MNIVVLMKLDVRTKMFCPICVCSYILDTKVATTTCGRSHLPQLVSSWCTTIISVCSSCLFIMASPGLEENEESRNADRRARSVRNNLPAVAEIYLSHMVSSLRLYKQTESIFRHRTSILAFVTRHTVFSGSPVDSPHPHRKPGDDQ